VTNFEFLSIYCVFAFGNKISFLKNNIRGDGVLDEKTAQLWQTVLLLAVDLAILSAIKLKQLGFI